MLAYFLGALGLGGIGFGLFHWYLSRRTLRRLDDMLTAAINGSFQEGGFDESAVSALETKMARFLNGSAISTRNLAEERAAIQALLSDLSHQTKTPIANILLYTSLLAEGELPPTGGAGRHGPGPERKAGLSDPDAGAGLPAGDRRVHHVAGAPPLCALLEEGTAQVGQLAAEKGLLLTVEPTKAAACFDPKWTAEALGNVVDNAIKYTPPGGSIRLSVREFELFCAVEVADDGPGIPEEEQGAVFHRFYRGKAVREQEGLGIGLYLTREILSRQGGYI